MLHKRFAYMCKTIIFHHFYLIIKMYILFGILATLKKTEISDNDINKMLR